MSIALTAIIMGALTSAMIVAGKALPSRENSAEATLTAATLADQIAAELHAAVLINNKTATAIDFTVADRNGDGNPERIRYDWSGVAGAPLMRTYNNGTPVAVVPDVHAFQFKYAQKSITETYPGPYVESAETLLSSRPNVTSLASFQITSGNWIGQFFQPALPGSAVKWRVSRVRFQAMAVGSQLGSVKVQLRPVDGSNKPTSTVLQQITANESSWGAGYAWQQFAFDAVNDRTPGTGLALVLEWGADTVAGAIAFDNAGGANRLTTGNGGGSWTLDAAKGINHEFYGTYTYKAPDQSITRSYVTGIRIGIQPGPDAEDRVDTNVNLPNQPEVLVDCWELDFSRDPTAVDIDADGVMDWRMTAGGGFADATLVGGSWLYDNGIEAAAPTNFNNPITVDLRCRDTVTLDGGPSFRIHLDWGAANRSAIYTNLSQAADLSQTLVVNELRTGSTLSPLTTITGIPNAMADIRLVIDPSNDSVSVTVNGQHRGTYRFGRYLLADSAHMGLNSYGLGAVFDHVRVRQGGTSP